MNKAYIKVLATKYQNGTASAEEIAILETWFISQQADSVPTETEMTADLNEIWLKLDEKPVKVRGLWLRFAAAASILVVLSFGGYFLIRKNQGQHLAQLRSNDITPGSNKAVLTLAGGQHIILTGAKNGKVAELVTKTGDGQLTYSSAPADAGFNTLSTPVGGQYEVSLPDGTKVWINSASSLKYPTSFAGLKERRVELAGEAYFEVVHNSDVPFKVVTNKQTVEDIGTHFNINSYDSAIKTTLLEGGIKINNSQVLTPGQEAIFNNNSLKIGNANTEEAIAWKNGYFRFNNENIRSIMPKLARWYNIEVAYNGAVSTVGFYGAISRNKNISEVLIMLEQTKGVHFKIEGRRVTVLE